jgi:hypothetical protein
MVGVQGVHASDLQYLKVRRAPGILVASLFAPTGRPGCVSIAPLPGHVSRSLLQPPQKKLPEVRPRAGEHHGKPNPGHQSHPSGERHDLFGHRSACTSPCLQRPKPPGVSRCGQLGRNLRKLLRSLVRAWTLNISPEIEKSSVMSPAKQVKVIRNVPISQICF